MVLGDNLAGKSVILIPKAGSTIPDLNGNALPSEGRRVNLNTYWDRRLRDGDVTIKSEPEKDLKIGGKR